jgi:hypothetical protein
MAWIGLGFYSRIIVPSVQAVFDEVVLMTRSRKQSGKGFQFAINSGADYARIHWARGLKHT